VPDVLTNGIIQMPGCIPLTYLRKILKTSFHVGYIYLLISWVLVSRI